MSKLLQCSNCHCKFKNLPNLTKHIWKKHPNSQRAKIQSGIRNSSHTPAHRLELQQKAIKESLEFLASVSTAVLTRNPALALQALKEGIDVLKAVEDLRSK